MLLFSKSTLLALGLLFALAACGGGGGSDDEAAADTDCVLGSTNIGECKI